MLILRGVVGMKAECLRVYSSIRTARSCLDVGKLVVRGVSRQSQPRQCLVGFHRVSSAHESCAVYLPSTQSSLVRPFSALSRCGCAFPVQMNASPVFPFLNVVRFRRRKMQRKPGDTPGDEEEESDEEDEEGGDDVDVSTLAFSEDSMLTSNYREMTTHVKSSRVDAVVSAGLGLPRNQIEELFLSSQLRLNGLRLLKKSQQLEEGDYIDYVFTEDGGSSKLKRVRVLKIEDTGRSGDKMKIFLRVWRTPQDPP